MKRITVKRKEKIKDKEIFLEEYSFFLKTTFKTYDSACFILQVIAFVLFSFGMWYHDLINVTLAVSLWLLCHIYGFILLKTGK